MSFGADMVRGDMRTSLLTSTGGITEGVKEAFSSLFDLVKHIQKQKYQYDHPEKIMGYAVDPASIGTAGERRVDNQDLWTIQLLSKLLGTLHPKDEKPVIGDKAALRAKKPEGAAVPDEPKNP